MNLIKRLPQLTAILAAFLLSLGATAQDFPIPYNPDDDANGLIGTPDLLSLLALFGEEFSAAVVAEDNESAIMYMGDMAYPLCAQSCRNLPGMWEMPTIEDLGLVWDEVVTSDALTQTWLKSELEPAPGFSIGTYTMVTYFESSASTNAANHYLNRTASMAPAYRCYCSIKEIPKVEYFTCTASCSDITELDACVNEKLAEGWQIHDSQRQQQVSSTCFWQPLWRWAE